MKRLSKAAVLTVAAGVAVMGSAGGALASDGGKDFDRGGASAEGAAVGSPGVLSGNVIQVPVNVPINLCGNSINTLAPSLLNFTTGNACINA
ncbi:chaplin [Actinacidiphila sp. bgisy167]|uniref:chaplin n=1 Tax=Actinacidiphila sp. bgisy167 TaxID=3413797 RepID=UPI003D75DD86